MNYLESVFGTKGRKAGQHLVENDTQGVEIRAVVCFSVYAPGLLRRHVWKQAARKIGREAVGSRVLRGETDIDEEDIAVRRIDQERSRAQATADKIPLV